MAIPVLSSPVQADFDRIALVSSDGWDHNSHYHRFLLKQAPSHCAEVLEIGCGTGAFARLLAERSERVVALDLSPQMIRIARERSGHYPHVDFQVADALAWDWPAGRFDCIASIATLHHLPLAEMLSRMERALRPNGTLLVLDLVAGKGLPGLLSSLVAVPAGLVLRLIRTGRLRSPPAVRAAWAGHWRLDSYLTLAQIRQACAAVLPGAHVRRHLLWRYSIIWRKPAPRSGPTHVVTISGR